MLIKSLSILFLIRKITAVEIQPLVDLNSKDQPDYLQAEADNNLVRKTRSSNFNQFNSLMSHIALNFNNLNDEQQATMTDFMQKLNDEMEANQNNRDKNDEETTTLGMLTEERSTTFNPKTFNPRRNVHKKREYHGNAKNNNADKPKKAAKTPKKSSWLGNLNTNDLGRFYG